MTAQLFGAALGVITLVLMYLLIRRGWLKEKYTLVWLFAGLVTLVVAVYPPIINGIARALGIHQGMNLLFVFADVAMMLVCLQLSVEASTLTYRTRALAEDVAILRLEVENQRRQIESMKGATPPAEPASGALAPGARREGEEL
ncbi:DUF2304 domain-containing protein [Flexivirga caeni]|uniref:DUF2304 domain-containing protein n=1 Tax=Flexivirga caeni TaxID=2294115 RepID=A0A3M9MII9_9MICO|nr:DUF2304 domain-containing protein [Flexivirga caeni]RNI25390.1 DUF2304 domain-containing protein [Flexivirga caeni]